MRSFDMLINGEPESNPPEESGDTIEQIVQEVLRRLSQPTVSEDAEPVNESEVSSENE